MEDLGPEVVSEREAEVLDALRGHLTNAEIGQKLHISVRTVESHVSSLLRKLGAADRRDLVARVGELTVPGSPATGEFVGLPGTWTTFVGRNAELEEVSRALATCRLVTLIGPGGVGKTRLAVVAARRGQTGFPAGRAFVDLIPVGDEFVLQAVASALGVVEQAQQPLERAVHDRLRAGRFLVVLDNCEHVLQPAADFAQSVMTSCPQTVVLATSRERLGVTGEQIVPLPPLEVVGRSHEELSDAERLFRDRAVGADGDPRVVGDICRRLDGMPLAIELAAARCASLGVDALLTGLDDHLRLLTRPSAAGARHGSLRNVIDWSYQLLNEDEQRVFRRLGVFAGAFDLASAATLATDGHMAFAADLIGRLTDKSLLVHIRDAAGSRWRMFDTVRAYARERLEASAEFGPTRHSHLLWATAAAGGLEQLIDSDGWSDCFDAIADDLRAALASALSGSHDEAGFELALALGHLCYARRFLGEARNHLRAAVTLARNEQMAVAALRTAADAAFAEMRGDVAFGFLSTAFERASAAGNSRAAAIVLAEASAIAGRAPATFVNPIPHERLVALVDQARRLAPPDDLEVATHIAVAAAWEGPLGPTIPDLFVAQEALALTRRLGEPVLISSALDATSVALAEQGRLKESARLTTQRLALLEELPRHDPRFGGEVADIFHMATESALAAGELEIALGSARRSYDDSTRQGLPQFAACHLVVPLVLQGAFDEALAHAAVMRESWERAGSPSAGWMAPSFFAAALAHGLRGEEALYKYWWDLALKVCGRVPTDGFRLFVETRAAVHLGAVDRARAAALNEGQRTTGMYDAYAQAISVEVAVIGGAPNAQERLARLAWLADENDFVAAQLLRATGRLNGDEASLKEAVHRWEAIGARFERACTLLLLSARVDEAASELATLGCPLPAA